jgi:hypothetical protein
MQHLVLLVLFAISPALYLLTGEWAFELAFCSLMKREKQPLENVPPQILVTYLLGGLLISLSIVFALACIGLPLWLAVLFSLMPLITRRAQCRVLLTQLRPTLTPNFLLWCSVIALLGTSLVGTADGYQTAWRNNYADFAWHLGMISSFTLGENFPPQNHIFPPLTLSYPFFINLWTASYWIFDTVPSALGWIFIYQWLFIWTAVYFALEGNRWRMLPWAALLGGGSYDFVFRTFNSAKYPELASFGPYAYDLLDHGYPWVPFLDSIWVTQRPALFGAPVLLTCVGLAHRALFKGIGIRADTENEKLKLTFFSGLLLGLSPLVHTHFFLITTCYLGMLFAIRALPKDHRQANLKLLALFCIGLSPAVLYAPWVLGKYGIVKIAGGWMQSGLYEQSGLLAAASAGAKLWWANGLLWLTLTALVVVLGKRFSAGAALAILFICGNLFQIAVWNWDEIKIFLALFLISISLWQTVPTPGARYAHWLLLALIIPGCVELGIVLKRYEMLTVFNRAELRDAALIRNSTSREAIIAAKPDHNSPVLLTGRKLYYGYEGTLSSHGIPYAERQAIQSDFSRLKNCRQLPEKPFCADYVFWSWREKNYWKLEVPGEGLDATEHYFLYRFK